MPKSPGLLSIEVAHAVQGVRDAMQGVRDAFDVLAAALQGQQQQPAAPPASEQRTKAAAGPRSRNGPRGTPPPAMFSLQGRADDAFLTEREVASLTRFSQNTLSAWRQRGDHPLKWVVVGGRIRYRVGDLRRFIESGYSVPRGRPRKLNPPVWG